MKTVQFYANTDDDTHCVQAAFEIMLKYFLPAKDYSYKQLDQMTGKQEGKGTWWPPGLINAVKIGLKAQAIEAFDYEKFYKQGSQYALDHFGQQAGHWYLANTNLAEIKESIPEFLQTVSFKCQPTTMDDIDQLLSGGWLVGLDINRRALNNLDGFVSHMVVIFDSKNDNYFMHDPGLPPRPNLEIKYDRLKEIWLNQQPNKVALLTLEH